MAHDIHGLMAGIKKAAATFAIPKEMPPSTKMAWQMHGLVQWVSSLKLCKLRPNSTQGQNSSVKPAVKNERM